MIDRTNTMIKPMNLVIGEESSFHAENVSVVFLNCNRHLVHIFLEEFPYDLNLIFITKTTTTAATTAFPTTNLLRRT